MSITNQSLLAMATARTSLRIIQRGSLNLRSRTRGVAGAAGAAQEVVNEENERVDDVVAGTNTAESESHAQAQAQVKSTIPAGGLSSKFPLYKPQPLPTPDPSALLLQKLHSDLRASSLPLKQKLKALELETKHLESQTKRKEKQEVTEDLIKDLPELTEGELEVFYRNLITAPAQEIVEEELARIGKGDDQLLIGSSSGIESLTTSEMKNSLLKAAEENTEERIGTITSLLERLEREGHTFKGYTEIEIALTDTEIEKKSPLALALEVLESNIPLVPISSTQLSPPISLGIVTTPEWEALFSTALITKDPDSAKRILALMEGFGENVPEEWVIEELNLLGRMKKSEELVERIAGMENAGLPVPKYYYESLVVAYLRKDEPTKAIALLRPLEQRSIFLPHRTYSSIISCLLTPLSRGLPMNQSLKALAWDFFTHTRLVAHPIPSPELYTSMIRACADRIDPQPEKALDLWQEMKQDTKVLPTRETYEALILACARVNKFYFQAFRILAIMLEEHHSRLSSNQLIKDPVSGRLSTRFEPTAKTFRNLLEGTKRQGDLPRARWILGEAVKLARSGAMELDSAMIIGGMHTYANFKPKISREQVGKGTKLIEVDGEKGEGAEMKIVDAQEESEVGPAVDGHEPVVTKDREVESVAAKQQLLKESIANQASPTSLDPVAAQLEDLRSSALVDISSPSFIPPTGPQSSAEALLEADRLFEAILAEKTSSEEGGDKLFTQVKITPRLVESYLSVHFAHSPSLRSAVNHWFETYKKVEVHPDGYGWLNLLEKLAYAKGPESRAVAAKLLPRVWKSYLQGAEKAKAKIAGDVRHSGKINESFLYTNGYGPRETERAWIAAIRLRATSYSLQGAFKLVQEFYRFFPPKNLTASYTPQPRAPTAVKVSSRSEQKEDNIPPHLLFPDVQILHNKMVTEQAFTLMGRLRYIVKDYQYFLGMRRNMGLKGQGEQVVESPLVERLRKMKEEETGNDQAPLF